MLDKIHCKDLVCSFRLSVNMAIGKFEVAHVACAVFGWKAGMCNISVFSEVWLSEHPSPACLALISSCSFQLLVLLFRHSGPPIPPSPSQWPPEDLCSHSSGLLESSLHAGPTSHLTSFHLFWYAAASVSLSWTLGHNGFLLHAFFPGHLEKSAVSLTKYLVTGWISGPSTR